MPKTLVPAATAVYDNGNMDEQPTNPQAGWDSANQPPQPVPQVQQPLPQQPQPVQPWSPSMAAAPTADQTSQPYTSSQLGQTPQTPQQPQPVPIPQSWQPAQPVQPGTAPQPPQPPSTSPQSPAWRPVAATMPPSATPQPSTWQPVPSAQPPMSERPKKQLFSKRMIIIAAALVLLLMVAAVAVLLFASGGSKSQYDKATSQISQSLATNGKVTDADLVLIDKTDLFLASANAMARQPVHHLVSETIGVGALNGKMAGDHVETADATFDYRNKDLNLTSQNRYISAPNVLDFNRCVDGVAYAYYDLQVRSNVQWERAETAGPDEGKDYCPLSGYAGVAIADGVNAGGLTTVQSNTFVQEIYKYASKGLLRISDAGLTERNSQQYIRLKAEIGWVQENIGGSRQSGMEYFMRAFKATGLNPQQHPYTTLNASSDKVRITTYIDPQTMLPAYAEYLTDIGIDGKTGDLRPATEENPYTLRRVQYGFGGSVVRGTVDSEPQPIKLSWPAEKR